MLSVSIGTTRPIAACVRNDAQAQSEDIIDVDGELSENVKLTRDSKADGAPATC